MSELVWDIKNGELESVRKEIENKVVSACDSLLFKMARPNGLTLCFSQGIDVNQEVDGRPLILYAADYGQVNIINYLLSKGANPNVSNTCITLSAVLNISIKYCRQKINMESVLCLLPFGKATRTV